MVMNTELELYRCDALPTFQNRTYSSAEEARTCPLGDLRLVQDLGSGLIYNAAFRPELMQYDEHYQNEQAVSVAFRRHLEEVAVIIERAMGRVSLVEVGCGKGYFLETLAAKGFSITGFDPAYEGNSPYIKKQLFQPEVGMEANGLVLRHVLEHIQRPMEFLSNLAKANGGHGLIYIEVPCFDWILAHRAWFDLFYEHVNYFRLSDFQRMFGRVVDSGRLFGGQYLYVIADLATLREPICPTNGQCVLPGDFLDTLAQAATGAGASVWGASSKGVIFSLMLARQGCNISTVIDINPAKQGKYLPASGMRVRSPEEALPRLPAGSTIYVMNSNYFEEIRQMSNNQYHYVRVDNE
jgi:hypothetical protein